MGCDPEAEHELPARWHHLAAAAAVVQEPRLTSDCAAAAASGPFDVVVCSLVLCALQRQTLEEQRVVLGRLRSAVKGERRDRVACVKLREKKAYFTACLRAL